MERTHYSIDLYKQYKKHLGALRYKVLLEGQILVVPQKVNELLKLGKVSLLTPLLAAYKVSRRLKIDWILKSLLLPSEYKKEIKELDVVPT